jgi:hypothetical protein
MLSDGAMAALTLCVIRKVEQTCHAGTINISLAHKEWQI